MICHNGEINTVRGNVNWMAARHETLASDLFGDDLEKLWPLIEEANQIRRVLTMRWSFW